MCDWAGTEQQLGRPAALCCFSLMLGVCEPREGREAGGGGSSGASLSNSLEARLACSLFSGALTACPLGLGACVFDVRNMANALEISWLGS